MCPWSQRLQVRALCAYVPGVVSFGQGHCMSGAGHATDICESCHHVGLVRRPGGVGRASKRQRTVGLGSRMPLATALGRAGAPREVRELQARRP